MHSTKPLEEKLNLDDSQWEDIHVVTGALKMFFRELPEPLFPYCFFEQFVETITCRRNHLKCINLVLLKHRFFPSWHISDGGSITLKCFHAPLAFNLLL
ncbi:hypothetical protein E2320_020329, partial [Naja naja]